MLIPEAEVGLEDQIREGRDLWVVLENRYGAERYVESYHLTSVVVNGADFLGKFRSVHSPDFHVHASEVELGGRTGMSYAYANFANIVATISAEDHGLRFYSALAYRTMKFIAGDRHEAVWDSKEQGDVGGIHAAVCEGRRLKASIELKGGISFYLPLHTVEVMLSKNDFKAHTDFDGLPFELLNFDRLKNAGSQLDEINVKGVKEIEDFYASSDFQRDIPFLYTFFEFDRKAIYQFQYHLKEVVAGKRQVIGGLEEQVDKITIFAQVR